ncbi:MAG: hypothetical protein ABJO86_00225 [Lentilitoribacter sp.]
MDNWLRIGDDETAEFGSRRILFDFDGMSYVISIDQTQQDFVSVEHNGGTNQWHVCLKEYNGECFKLSGAARIVPHILGDLYWFELLVSKTPIITYWGDKIIYRTDRASA